MYFSENSVKISFAETACPKLKPVQECLDSYLNDFEKLRKHVLCVLCVLCLDHLFIVRQNFQKLNKK